MSENNYGYEYNTNNTGNTNNAQGSTKAPSKKKGVWMIVLAVLCLAYIVSPIDAIPDILVGLGQVDDMGALVGMVSSIIAAIKGFKAGRAYEQDDEVNDVENN